MIHDGSNETIEYVHPPGRIKHDACRVVIRTVGAVCIILATKWVQDCNIPSKGIAMMTSGRAVQS